jgi:hypothetical protein
MKDESNCCTIRKSVRLQCGNSFYSIFFNISTTFLYKHNKVSVSTHFFHLKTLFSATLAGVFLVVLEVVHTFLQQNKSYQ